MIHKMYGAQYFKQMASAREWEREFQTNLKSSGWIWDEAGFWFHPEDKSTQIWPG